MSFFLAYLFVTIISSKAFIGLVITFICSFLTLVVFITMVLTEDGDKVKESFIKYFKLLKHPLYTAVVLSLLIPSMDNVKLIVGGAVTYEVITSDVVKGLPKKTMKAVDLFLEKMEIDIDSVKKENVE